MSQGDVGTATQRFVPTTRLKSLVWSHAIYDDSVNRATHMCCTYLSVLLTKMNTIPSSSSTASGRHLEVPASRSVYRLQAVDGCVLLVLGGLLAGG